ncbi:hypothetical protein [Undibacter mobilis]|uniref:hypothetical protein n=1 Tax=Undibacter mobilis TaxID=2292256 RepID=UPI0011C01E9C|nr:hypothetical protein [Undibacter mobilis]
MYKYIILLAALFAFVEGAVAQVVRDKCEPVAPLLASSGGPESRLFLKSRDGWTEIAKSSAFSLAPNSLPIELQNQNLRFIYAAPKVGALSRQYLAIRTSAVGNGGSNFVSLRKQRAPFAKEVHFGTYQEYHDARTDNSRVLRHYHNWGADRSDNPVGTRHSFKFGNSDFFSALFARYKTATRRLLTITYLASSEHRTCVNFVLKPPALTAALPDEDEDDADEVSLLTSFTIDITEARTFSGDRGATFTIQWDR